MTGIVHACPLFSKLVDRLAPISAEQASALKSVGIVAVGRYLENLSPFERDNLFSVGLGILPLSEAPTSPLNADSGKARADTLIQKATLLGVPAGAHVMIDLEAQQGSHADIGAYDGAISAEIAHAGFVPLAYVGAGQQLTGTELYMLPNVHLYWRGGSLGIPEPNCGFAIWQVPPLEQTIAGMIVDVNVTGADLRGRQPMLWWQS